MKRIIQICIFLVLTISYVSEGKIFVGEKFTLNKEQTIKEELFVVAEQMFIHGKVENEFIGLAKNLYINGLINGDIIGAGLHQEFDGIGKNDLYMLGETIKLKGDIHGSATVFGKEITFNDVSIGGNLRAGADNIILKGNVGEKTVLFGNELAVSGKFKDLVVYGKKISLGDNTLIDGDFVYHFNEEMLIPPGVKINGQVKWEKPVSAKLKKKTIRSRFRKLFSFLSLLIPFLVMLIFTPNLLSQTVLLVGEKPLQCIGFGIGLLIFIPVVILIIFLTIVGAPLGLIATSIFLSLLYLSRVFPAIFIGRKILNKMPERKDTWILSTIIGIFIFTIFISIPRIGMLLNLLFLFFGFGALISGRIQFFKKLREEKIL